MPKDLGVNINLVVRKIYLTLDVPLEMAGKVSVQREIKLVAGQHYLSLNVLRIASNSRIVILMISSIFKLVAQTLSYKIVIRPLFAKPLMVRRDDILTMADIHIHSVHSSFPLLLLHNNLRLIIVMRYRRFSQRLHVILSQLQTRGQMLEIPACVHPLNSDMSDKYIVLTII